MTESTTLTYARVLASLKKLGRPIPANDAWIGAGNAWILCSRHPFERFEGQVYVAQLLPGVIETVIGGFSESTMRRPSSIDS